jgi:hypothetical protein
MQAITRCGFKGRYKIEHFRDGKLLHTEEFDNGVVDVGITDILDVAFRDAATKKTGWAIGFIDNAGSPTLDPSDTMASHAGWTEFTSYSEVNRPAWAPDAAAAKAIVNGTARDFNITASGTIYGTFCADDNTKGGAGGLLWATAALGTPIPVNLGDLLRITYTVTGA